MLFSVYSLKEAVSRYILLLFGFTCSGKTRKNPGRNKDSGNTLLGRNQGRRTEYTPLIESFIDYIVALHLVGARNAYHTYIFFGPTRPNYVPFFQVYFANDF